MKNRNVIAAAIFTMCTNSAINVVEYYLPTYYQIVCEYSPSKSGYMMIPIVIGRTIGMLLCGPGTSTIGYYTPFMLFSSAIMPIFVCLVTIFGVDTRFVRLVLYSSASGFASGVGFNAPLTAVQTVLPKKDISLGIAIVLFTQNFGPAVFIAIAQVIFTNGLSANLARQVPGLNPVTVESSGLTEIFGSAQPVLRGKTLYGISRRLRDTWYLAVGRTCATLIGSLLMEWRSVKQKNP